MEEKETETMYEQPVNLKSWPGVMGLMIFLFITSCCPNDILDQGNSKWLINCWKHAYEEGNFENSWTYRACHTKDWPLSRYRNTFILEENHQAKFSVSAPNDAHYFEEGTWLFNSETKMLYIMNEDGDVMNEYEVLEIQLNKLLLRG